MEIGDAVMEEITLFKLSADSGYPVGELGLGQTDSLPLPCWHSHTEPTTPFPPTGPGITHSPGWEQGTLEVGNPVV